MKISLIWKSVITAGVIVAGLSTTTMAASHKTTGDASYHAYGLQRQAKFTVTPDAGSCTTKWVIKGNYTFSFNLNGDPTQYAHEVTLKNNDSLSGTGGYPVGGPHVYEWKVTSGHVSGSTLTLAAKYTLGADALSPLTKMNLTGTIAADGTISGTWSDNYQGGSRNGQWHTTAGAAVQKAVGCQADGDFKYSDASGNQYKVNVRFVKFSGNDAWFAGPVKSGNVGAGQWLLAKVHDDGNSGDQISGSFIGSDVKAAKLAVALMTNPTYGPFAITSGTIKVQ